MTQRKPDAERSKRRGSENRQRSTSVAVRLTAAERGALTEASKRTGQGAATLLREAFLATVSEGAFPPSAAQVRAWLTGHGWTSEPVGPSGAIWHGGTSKDGVAVPHADGDEWFTWGAVTRIARSELRAVADVALEMMAISPDGKGGSDVR
jgi:hypothetical protein